MKSLMKNLTFLEMFKERKKLAIVDFTDCEGCQTEFFNVASDINSIISKFDIVSWRMTQDLSKLNDLDICLIEGTPITSYDRERAKNIRSKSSLVGSLGSCADLGGIIAILKDGERKKAFNKIYSKNKPFYRQVKPLSEIIKVDFKIPGCPIRPTYLKEALAQLLIDKLPQPKPYSVCMECKLKGNDCLLNKGIPCLGPITNGGCKAICPFNNQPCLGCFGIMEGAQVEKLKQRLIEMVGKQKTDDIFRIFLNNYI
jgi:coenzyme F420-reducing hydrogenase gamma subunit